MKKLLAALIMSLMLAMPLTASAEDGGTKFGQLALFEPIQIFDKDTSVKGIRWNIFYGVNKDVGGLDLGLANKATGDVGALEIGLANMVGGDFTGIQWGFYNDVGGSFTGWQDGAVNMVGGDFVGLQTGLYNKVGGKASGLQLAIVNDAGSLYGLQIGIINFNKSKEPFGFLPIVNFSF